MLASTMPSVSRLDRQVKADDEDTLRDGFEHYAFQCLYLCAGDEGEEPQLKYYAFENGGIVWDDDSEPDHDRIERLRPDILYRILTVVAKTFDV